MKRAKNMYKKYTEKEHSMLEEWVGNNTTYKHMAEQLGRSVKSVKRKIERLGIEDKHVMTGTISATELARILNYNPTSVIAWIKKEGLPAEKKSFLGKRGKAVPYYIIPEDFWKWAEPRKSSIHFSDMERYILLPEPIWLEEEIQRERELSKKRKFWKPEEDEAIWNMFYVQEMTQSEIAKHFSVTRHSIQRRLARIRKERMGRHDHPRMQELQVLSKELLPPIWSRTSRPREHDMHELHADGAQTVSNQYPTWRWLSGRVGSHPLSIHLLNDLEIVILKTTIKREVPNNGDHKGD